jgi:hypothetical protein
MTAQPPIFQLIYFSKRLPESTLSVIELICESAFVRNRADNVTGLLVYNPTMFLQLIEGPIDAVRNCYARIARDDRHSLPLVIWEQFSEARAFPDGAAMRIEAGSNERFASILALADLESKRDHGWEQLQSEGLSRSVSFKEISINPF